MAEKRISLDVIGVAEPCHEDWSGMSGGEQKKFCDSCAKHVHNLSEMTREEAESFVNENPTGVCIRFHRDTRTGKMLTAEDPRNLVAAQESVEPRPPSRGRFSGPVPPSPRHRNTARHHARSTSRRRAYRLAGNAYVPFLAVFSLLAGVVAVILNGGRAPTNTGTNCTMGEAAPPPTHQPQQGQPMMGAVAVPPAPQDPPVVEPVPPVLGIIAAPQPQPQPAPIDPVAPVVSPAVDPEVQPLMGRIAPQRPQPPLPNPPQPEPLPEPPPAPPEVMGEIHLIMGDIVCPEEPIEQVKPIAPPPRDGNAAQH